MWCVLLSWLRRSIYTSLFFFKLAACLGLRCKQVLWWNFRWLVLGWWPEKRSHHHAMTTGWSLTTHFFQQKTCVLKFVYNKWFLLRIRFYGIQHHEKAPWNLMFSKHLNVGNESSRKKPSGKLVGTPWIDPLPGQPTERCGFFLICGKKSPRLEDWFLLLK